MKIQWFYPEPNSLLSFYRYQTNAVAISVEPTQLYCNLFCLLFVYQKLGAEVEVEQSKNCNNYGSKITFSQ